MRVASKVAAGSALLLVLFTGTLAYHLALVRDLVAAHRDLSTQKTRAARVTLEAMRLLDEMEEYVKKLGVTGDRQYAAGIDQRRTALTGRLEELAALELSEAEKAEVEGLVARWREIPALPAAADDVTLSAAAGGLGDLRSRARRLLAVIEKAVEEEAETSAAVGEAAPGVALLVIATALGLSVVVVALTVRSINEPLRRLVAGTRAVSKGEFDLELDATRNDEFAHLAADFNAMVSRLGELDEMKKDLLSHVSHELKTPLATIQETHQVLLDEIPGELNPRQRRLLELNLESSERLSRLITKLLDLSRLEAGVVGYDLGRCDAGTLLKEAVTALERRARARRLGVRLELPPAPVEVSCDADRLLQVFDNLLENAIKFSPEGGVIDVRIRRTEELPHHLPTAGCVRLDSARDFVLVTVSDAGPGIPDEEKERVFARFHQAGARRRGSVGGVGLGLAICREIVEAHRGAVWVCDNEPRGSTFLVLLPAGGERPPPPDGRAGETETCSTSDRPS